MDVRPEAMDVESRNFKSYQQVPTWLSTLWTVGVAIAVVVAFVALGLGAAAVNKANNDDEAAVVERATTAGSAAFESFTLGASPNEMEQSSRPLPGSANYTGYRVSPPSRTRTHFDVVVEGHVGDGTFDRLQKGIDDAAQLFNVEVSYFDPETLDEVADHDAAAARIRNSARQLKSGLAVAALRHTSDINRAIDEASYDMPVLSLLLDFQEDAAGDSVHTFTNVGFESERAAIDAADLFSNAGAEVALCLEEDRSVRGQQRACNAFEQQFGADNTISRTAQPTDPEFVQDLVDSALRDDGVQAILTLGTASFEVAYAYLQQTGRLCSRDQTFQDADCVLIGTFGETERVLQGIRNGSVAFAADTQQYLQGYLAILLLRTRVRFSVALNTRWYYRTGPVMITKLEEAEKKLSRDIMGSKTVNGKLPSDLDIRFVVHGRVYDPYWTAFKNGIRAASRETGVSIDFRHPDSDRVTPEEVLESQVEMIREAEADGVDALVVTLPANDSDLRTALMDFSEATEAPIYSVNAGHAWFQDFPIRAHIGEVAFEDAIFIAERLAEMNIEMILCVVHDADDALLSERCDTLRTFVTEDGTNEDVELVILNTTAAGDPLEADDEDFDNILREAVLAQLEADEDLQVVVSTGLMATPPIRNAIADRLCMGTQQPTSRNGTCLEFIAYDVDPRVFNYIKSGEVLFAVQHSPTFQGYMAVHLAMIDVLYDNHLTMLVPTGPSFVDASNVVFAEEIYGFLTAS